jgi:hypothetical protein
MGSTFARVQSWWEGGGGWGETGVAGGREIEREKGGGRREEGGGRREEDEREKSSWLGLGTALFALSASPAKSVPVNTVCPATMMRWVRLDQGVLPRGSLEGYKSCGADMEVESSMIGGGAEKLFVSAGDALSRHMLSRLRTFLLCARLCACIYVCMHVCTYVYMFFCCLLVVCWFACSFECMYVRA